jgi:predicted Zn-dependent protease
VESDLKDRTEIIRPSSLFLRAIPGALLALAVILPLSTGFLEGQAPRTLPGPNDALFRSATDCLDQRRYLEAEALCQQLYELEPGEFRAVMGLMEVYTAENRADEAIRLAQAEADKNPASTELRMAFGAAAANPKDPKALLQLAQQWKPRAGPIWPSPTMSKSSSSGRTSLWR